MKKVVVMVSLIFSFLDAQALLENDQAAYDYCLAEKDSFVAVVWPIAQGKDYQIDRLFKKFGSIKYQKKVYFTPAQASHLLAMAHSHVVDMDEHMARYFPPGTFEKPARIFVFKCSSYKKALSCKYAIRAMLGLDFRGIHINDWHWQTIELAGFFFKDRDVLTASL